MRNSVERQLSQEQHRTGILVPLLEDYMKTNYGYWDQDDQDYLSRLMLNDSRREKRRRRSETYSPSLLGGCRRRTFLAKHHRELDIKPLTRIKPETSHHFWTGTWAHLRLQLRLYQLQKHGALTLEGTEIPIGRRGHSGTVDAVVTINGRNYVVDFKFINDRAFQMIVDKQVPEHYKIQIADYVVLLRAERWQIDGALLIAERKSGPTPDYPAALCEYRVNLKVNIPKAVARIEELKGHAEAHTIPDPECQAITQHQFQNCPFRNYCRQEVREIQRAADSSHPAGIRVAIPKARRPPGTR
jgi:hypothetical protein